MLCPKKGNENDRHDDLDNGRCLYWMKHYCSYIFQHRSVVALLTIYIRGKTFYDKQNNITY